MPGDPTPGSLAQKDATTLGNMICRDYLRGVCYRADNCKFLHSEQHAPICSNQLPVCRDYQNGTCNRRNCKYAHIYSSSGFYDPVTMTAVPQGASSQTNQNATYPKPFAGQQPAVFPDHPPPFEEVFKTRAGNNDPLCKDFQNGFCQRGENCRFRHISYIHEPAAAYRADPNANAVPNIPVDSRHYSFTGVNADGPSPMYLTNPPPQNYSAINPSAPANQNPSYSGPTPAKRPFISNESYNSSAHNGVTTSTNMEPSHLVKELEMIRNENTRLREELSAKCAEIDSLKEQLSRYTFQPHNGVISTDQKKHPTNLSNNYQRPNNSSHSQKSPSKIMYNQNPYPPPNKPNHYNN